MPSIATWSPTAGLIPPWGLMLFPGAAITITVLAFNLLGDGIRDRSTRD